MDIKEDFFTNYRGRYSSYWLERWGLIPELPTSFDNANSIYELLAWLQRAFKQLLDDFVALESELEDFKNAFTELLENLVPLLIRRYMASKEADDWFNEKADRYYQTVIKPYIDNEVRKLNDRITNEVNRLDSKIDNLREEFEAYKREQDGKTRALETALMKLINNLEGSGAWSGGLAGGLNSGRNLATGNINLYDVTSRSYSFPTSNFSKAEPCLSFVSLT